MDKWLNRFWSEDGCGCGCGCGHDHEHHHHDEEAEGGDDPVIEIVDPETGETFSFYYADEFEFEDKNYCVLVTIDEEDPQYVIGRVVLDENGDSFVETLGDEENDAVYDAYEKLLEEYFEEDEEEDEE